MLLNEISSVPLALSENRAPGKCNSDYINAVYVDAALWSESTAPDKPNCEHTNAV